MHGFEIDEQVELLVRGQWVYATIINVDIPTDLYFVETAIGTMWCALQHIKKVSDAS